MSELNIGGFGFKRYSDISSALENSRTGDKLKLKRNEKVKETGYFTEDIELDGGGNILYVSENYVAFIVSNQIKIQIKNLKIILDPKSNFILIDESFTGKLILENVSIEYSKKGDPRDWYSPIISNKSVDYSLVLKNTSIPYITLLTKNIVILDSNVGNYFGMKSKLLISDGLIEHSSINNILLQSLYGNDLGLLKGYQLRSNGGIVVSQIAGEINKIVFGELVNKKIRSFTKKREFDNHFLNSTFIPENYIVPLLSGNGLKSFSIENIQFESISTDVYSVHGLNLQNSDVVIKNTEIPLFNYKNIISNSTIRLENVVDESQWSKSGKVVSSNLNSSSSLLGASESSENFILPRNNMNALEELDQYIGLENVKTNIKEMVSLAKMNAERRQRGLPETKGFSLHMVFSGSAGTGKTTMAKLMARALYENGILPTNKFVVATRKDLVAGYIGQTATKTHELIKSAKGGVLFIDEAYSLTPQGGQDFANEAVDQLVMDAEELREDTVIILAGYTNEMKHFINTANTGLSSRFKNWIEFSNYTLQELVQILFMVLKQQGALLGENEKKSLVQSFKRIYDSKTQNGSNDLNGNARFVRNYVQDLIMTKDMRVSTLQIEKLSNEDLMRILINDIEAIEPKYL